MFPFLEEFREVLGPRYATFTWVLLLLRKRGRPIHIVETGCARVEGNFQGDGLSTLIFGRFLKEVSGGSLETIDISPENVRVCRSITQAYRQFITYTVGDSVEVLRRMSPDRIRKTDLFYLDSMDLKRRHPERSMKHHLKELLAIYQSLSEEVLIMTDDNLGDIAKGGYVKDYLLVRGWVLLNSKDDLQWIFARHPVPQP